MLDNHILIIGGGAIGMPVAKRLAKVLPVTVIRRSHQEIPSEMTDAPLNMISGDMTILESITPIIQKIRPTIILICVSPSEYAESAYRKIYVTGTRNIIQAIDAAQYLPKKVIFVSSTSVYHQNNDEWVNEETEVVPQGFSGQVLLEAETLLAQSQFSSTVVRFSGIYGGGRTRLLDQILEGNQSDYSLESYTNRIHESDCINLLCYLIELSCKGVSLAPCYLASDSFPTRMGEVFKIIQNSMDNEGIEYPKKSGKPSTAPKQGIRRAGSKRCSNKAIVETGYEFLYPSCKEGYSEMVRSLSHQLKKNQPTGGL